MEACLYEPEGGFFATGPLRSTREGDFLTSPEVSPWFGRTLARYVADAMAPLERPVLVEVGAGSGSLLAPLLEGLGRSDVTTVAVEASPQARRRLERLPGVDRVLPSLDELDSDLEGVVIANELLDNLPVALAVRTADAWEERWVDAEDGELTLVAAPPRPQVAAWADRYAGPVPPGGQVEIQMAATSWVGSAVARIRRGALALFDYGGTSAELEPRRSEGTLRTYRHHHLGPDPLLSPGETDVTVDVDFTAMAAAAAAAGGDVEVMRQDDFLVAWGLGDDVDGLRSRERELAASGDALARLMVRAERIDAETLLHPRGLGDFRVLLVRR